MKLRCRKCRRVLYDERHQRIDRPLSCTVCGGVMAIEDSESQADLGIHPLLAKRIQRRGTGNPPVVTPQPKNDESEFNVPPRVTIKSQEGSATQGAIESDIEAPPPAPGKTQVARRQTPRPPKEPNAKIKVDGYEVLEQVGKGAMGAVFRARHLASGRDAAVKILAQELASRPDFVMRFEREAAALRAVHHSGVVAILDSGETGGKHYLCMEYVHGVPLRRLLRDGALPPARAISHARQILQALAAAHDRGVIHRDLKPENVLVRRPEGQYGTHPDEELVLVDFGLAGIVDEADDPHPNLTKSAITMGTVNYMAPEQRLDAKRVDHRADIYSCGVMLYELITGDLPLGRFALPTEKGASVPASLDDCIVKALARQPSERYQQALEMDEALALVSRDVREMTEKDSLLPQKAKRPQKQPFQLYDTRISSNEDPIHVEALDEEELEKRLAVATENNWVRATQQMPWVKKPVLLGGIVALLLGALAGGLLNEDNFEEYALTANEALGQNERWTQLEAGALERKIEKNNEIVSLKKALKTGAQENWQVQSTGWQFQEERVVYSNQKDKTSFWRGAPSFLVTPTSFDADLTMWKTEMLLKAPPAHLLGKDKARVIQEGLGGILPGHRGGIFIYNQNQQRAIGFILSHDGSCSLESFHRQGGRWLTQKKEAGFCNEYHEGKPTKLALICTKSGDNCKGYLKGKDYQQVKEKVTLENVGIQKGTWHYALGCLNGTCSFKPFPIQSGK
jgi:serine/threonine protein kinase